MILNVQIHTNKTFGLIFNNDATTNLFPNAVKGCTPDHYKNIVRALLQAARPGIFVMDEAGDPDPVLFRSNAATYYSKHLREVYRGMGEDFMDPAMAQGMVDILNNFVAQGTDVLTLTIQACREANTRIIPSFRMGPEDYYHMQWALSDFSRAHRDWVIPGRTCLDPAVPEVFDHFLDIFREVVENYDIDGIELNFRRWTFMISDPHKNHPILTRLVSEVRKILDDAAGRKGRDRLILGTRVGPLIEGPFIQDEYPGSPYGQWQNPSCRDLGLDVKTWIASGDIDYLSPMLFISMLPGLPRIREFVDLARGTNVGIYPTLFSAPFWLHEAGPKFGIPQEPPIDPDDTVRLRRYKNELCEAALKIYAEGADGISTFNWDFTHQPGIVHDPDFLGAHFGLGGKRLQMRVASVLGNRKALEDYYRSNCIL